MEESAQDALHQHRLANCPEVPAAVKFTLVMTLAAVAMLVAASLG